MSDSLRNELTKLTPEVDLDASRALFAERRVGNTARVPGGLMSAVAAALVVGGIIGLWAITRGRDAPTVPADAPPPAERPEPTAAAADAEAPPAFEVIAVLETENPFGTIHVAGDQASFDAWRSDMAAAAQPRVDFSEWVVVAFTLPDDACPDILQRFDVTEGVWTPVFEPPAGGCDDPLITRTYVTAVDRSMLGDEVTFALTGDDRFDYPSTSVTLTLADAPPRSTERSTDETSVPLGISVPLPERGAVSSSLTLDGPVWIVHHDDGDVSAVAGISFAAAFDADAGVSGLASLVRWDEANRQFVGRFVYDEYGRALNGPRTADLSGFDVEVGGSEAEILKVVSKGPIEGQPIDSSRDDSDAVLPDLGELFTIDLLRTLSYSGPIWRYVDATLVVQGGVGQLCDVDVGVPVPDLGVCVGDAWETAITSDRPEITSWFFGPLFAQFDEHGVVTRVAPMNGQSSRTDGPVATFAAEEVEVIIDGVSVSCDETDRVDIEVTFQLGAPTPLRFEFVRSGVVVADVSGRYPEGLSTAVMNLDTDVGVDFGDRVRVTPVDAHDVVLAEHPTVGCG